MSSKSECIALAKKKLRDYKSRNRRKSLDDVSSPSPSISSCTEINGRKSEFSSEFAHDEVKSASAEIGRQSQSSRSSIVGVARGESHHSLSEKNFDADRLSEVVTVENLGVENNTVLLRNDSALEQRYNSAVKELGEVVGERDQLKGQLVELHGYYTDLHAAYTKLNDCIQNGNSSNGSLQVQLLQLQNALNVVVNEKTDLQQQLREAKEVGDRRLMENQSLIASFSQFCPKNDISLNDKQSKVLSLESDLLTYKKELDYVHILMQNQTKELEQNRKELADWQSRVLHVQQDRNEAQERQKYALKELEKLQVDLDETRKQLKLKEIYLRQVAAYNSESRVDEDSVKSLHEEIERLKAEVDVGKKESENWKEQSRLAHEHFEACRTEMNQNLSKINAKLSDALNDKMLLETKVYTLEDELKVLKCSQEKNHSTMDIKDEQLIVSFKNEEKESLLEMEMANEKLMHRITALDMENSGLRKDLNAMQTQFMERSKELESKEESLIRLQEAFEEQRKFNEEVRELSDRLQNEKATVSRALAQNRELKDQLIELQDKIVFLSEENMEKESNRLSALHMIDQLKLEIEEIKSEGKGHSDPHSTGSTSGVYNADTEEASVQSTDEVDQTTSPIESSELEGKCCDSQTQKDACSRAELAEAELAQVFQDLGNMRNEFRRVNQENEELRRIMEQNAEDENQNNIIVELNQAIARINVLSSENEGLRERLQTRNSINIAELSTSDNSNNNSSSETVSKNDEFDPIMQKPLAWVELEARFSRAMRQNADLVEQNERLEHIITELQSENDTIGEYVTIYQHQRRIVKERMRQCEDAVARLSLEKTRMQRKMADLQKSLINLFSKKGLVRSYDHNLQPNSPKTSNLPIVKRANKMRTYSESIIDETTGYEQMIVNGFNEEIPDVHVSQNESKSKTSEKSEPDADCGSRVDNLFDNGDDSTVSRIMELVKELQGTDQSKGLQAGELFVHCNECSGNLIRL